MRRFPILTSILTLALIVAALAGSHAWAARRFGRLRAPSVAGRTIPHAPRSDTSGTQLPSQNSPSDELQEPAQHTHADNAVRIDPHQAMADLLAVRRSLGGDSPVSDADFAAALQDVIEEREGVTVALPRALQPAAVAPPVAAGNVAALRQSAAHFEARAAELEAARDYDEADTARATAAALRQEARRLDP
jgi:hypothetical protein